jgi:diadenosine tetraphosphate (Ap4A) HIT family hydrolase
MAFENSEIKGQKILFSVLKIKEMEGSKGTSEGIHCEACTPVENDKCCVGVLHNCKIVVKPSVYDYISPTIIVSPLYEHKPYWELSSSAVLDMHAASSAVAQVFLKKLGLFPNFFVGGNINNAKYGLQGVHAHVHIEPRTRDDPNYMTVPAHQNRRNLSDEEIEKLKAQWKQYLGL